MFILISFPLLITVTFAETNPKLLISRHNFYKEIGCTLISTTADPPTGYTCPNYTEIYQPDKCYFRDQAFSPGDDVTNDQLEAICIPSCRCTQYGDNPATFSCAHNDCPEFFGLPRLERGCIRTYSFGKCCSTGIACGEEKDQLHRCSFEGSTYYDGQTMQPKGTCYTCICDANFDSATPIEQNTNCKESFCNVMFHDLRNVINGCAPVFYKNLCCPIKYRCRK